MISLRHLGKKFGETVAVNDLTLDIAPGEIFGLIGPDGAGKTTTLRVLATAMLPTSGHVTVDGLDAARDAEAVKKIIGYMPQRFALYPDLTVIENLNFFADMYGAPPRERAAQIDRLLGFARLNEFRARRAGNLSGGMQKKLALAATLMHHPRVLLLDEPTTGVDPLSRREFWDLLSQVHLEARDLSPGEKQNGEGPADEGNRARKVTIVISTPYLDEAERCTRVGLMYHGDLIACDAPTKLRDAVRATVFEAQTPDAMRARKTVEANDGVLSASVHGDLIRVIADRVERESELQAAWNASGISIDNLHRVKPRLEDAFVLLVKEPQPMPPAGTPS